VRVLTVHSFLQSGSLGYENVDLNVLVALHHFLFLGSFGPLASLTALLILIFGFLVNQTLSCEEVAHQAAFLHHILRERTYDTHNSSEQSLD
jgi:hypothetical protein